MNQECEFAPVPAVGEHLSVSANSPWYRRGRAVGLASWQGRHGRAHPRRGDERAGGPRAAEPEVRRQRRLVRLNVILYNLLSAFKRLALPDELHVIRPKRLRFLVLNTLARLVSHARERRLRCASAFARTALDRFRIRGPPPEPA